MSTASTTSNLRATPIRLVVFDWAGTTVDHGSLAPVHAFGAAFRAHGVELTQREIRGPMGLHKKDHIRNLFGLETAASQWKLQHGRDWCEDDVEALYEKLVAAGYSSINPPVDVVRGGVTVARAVYALDPDGISVELFEEFEDVVKK